SATGRGPARDCRHPRQAPEGGALFDGIAAAKPDDLAGVITCDSSTSAHAADQLLRLHLNRSGFGRDSILREDRVMTRPSPYPLELRRRGVRMAVEVRLDYDTEWAAMKAVASSPGSARPRRCASGSGRTRSTPAPCRAPRARSRPS